MQESNEILLHMGEYGWLATFVGPHATRLVNLFGTSTIPTAYTARTSLESVIAGIAARNPHAVVKHWLY
jgi:hypothetical protein